MLRARPKGHGIPVVVESPGVGQNLRDHTNVSVRSMVEEDVPQDPNGMRAFRLRYTAMGSDSPNDMSFSPVSLDTSVRDDNPAHTVSCRLYLADGKSELRLKSTDPHTPPSRSKSRENVRLRVQHKCHSVIPAWYQMTTLREPPGIVASEVPRRPGIS